jgi:flavin reductase (DIM6/NTAB) family NADH-FMN oxidoreductase RutF
MNLDHKKTVLRMIPYGIYVLTSDDGKGDISAATVNWVTQTAFVPPLLVVGVKTTIEITRHSTTPASIAANGTGRCSR